MGHVSVLGEPAVQRGHRAWVRAVLPVTQLLGCVTLGIPLNLCVSIFSLIQCSYQYMASEGHSEAVDSCDAPSMVSSL